MIDLLIFAAQLAAASPLPVPPQDWSSLRPLPLAHDPADAPNLSAFVQGEVRAGRCAAAMATAGGWVLKIDLAVLVGPAAQPRRIIPRAIDCPSVEQYAAGLISSAARGNIPLNMVTPDTWYRTSLTFSWPA